MTRADRVHSTPPISTSLNNNIAELSSTDGVDTSRRRFLSQAAAVTAGGAVLATAPDRPQALGKPLIRF